MDVLLVYEGRKADHCQLARYHAPNPLRFIWHHVQPKEAGGATVEENLAQLCDNDHYAVHRLMWELANGGVVSKGSRYQMALARAGYEACVAAGTTSQIPNEG
jgi:HNH endonuclease